MVADMVSLGFQFVKRHEESAEIGTDILFDGRPANVATVDGTLEGQRVVDCYREQNRPLDQNN